MAAAGRRASAAMAQALCAQMKATLAAIREFDREIEELCSEQEDYELFVSFPGAGKVHTSRLLAAMGARRGRRASADELLRFSGVAPAVERSGRSSWTRWRFFCPKFLRQSFVEYAGESIRHSQWARAYYEQQRARGKSHQAAVRALSYKWIRIIFRCWQARTPYDEARYSECLRRKGSPLVPVAS